MFSFDIIDTRFSQVFMIVGELYLSVVLTLKDRLFNTILPKESFRKTIFVPLKKSYGDKNHFFFYNFAGIPT